MKHGRSSPRTEGVSCWIGEKDWEIAPPVGCEEFDYGNVIDLFDTGIVWSCYSDFGWNLDADPLEYGSGAVVGQFRCESETTGVTCTNGAGNGFCLGRAAAEVF